MTFGTDLKIHIKLSHLIQHKFKYSFILRPFLDLLIKHVKIIMFHFKMNVTFISNDYS